MKKIVAIDPSLNGTGIAYRDASGNVRTKRVTVKKLRGLERLAYVRDYIEQVLDRIQPDAIVIEDYAMGIGKTGMTFTIGELGGTLKLLAYDLGMSVVLASPATLKKFVTGKGNAKKEVVAEHALRRWDRDFDSDDECDAFCLLMLGERYYSRRRDSVFPWNTLRTERRTDRAKRCN